VAAPTTVAPPRSARPGQLPRRPGRRGGSAFSWLLVGPNAALVAVFLLLPLGWAVWLSFRDAGTFGPTRFTGLENYRRMFGDEVFWQAVLNTVVFTLATVPTSIALGLALAVLLDRALPAQKVWRTIIYLPIVLSGLATALIGALMFEESIGIVNKLLRALGVAGPDWQTDGAWAMASLVLVTVWVRVGFSMVIYLAGIQDVPRDLYEAARLDGANGWQQFRRVTVPLVRPTTFFLVVLNVIYSFQVFDLVYAMTNGGPGFATTTLPFFSYQYGFQQQEQGYGSAIGLVLFVAVLVFTAVQWRSQRDAVQGGA
jgi:multiple sugar transport system permease protein